MLFNSFIFIFVFLPITLFGFFAIGKLGHFRVAIAWLVGASLVFYGWWNPAYLWLILFSILFNYSIGVLLGSHREVAKKKTLLTIGVIGNLALLGYYKYANFFVSNLNELIGTNYNLEVILLPLAISFFTFQQIAYLVDAYRGETREYNFLHYCLFVTFFPQLIAGPIVHHKEMLPQFVKDSVYAVNYKHISIGLTIFIIGLFKKVILADGAAAYATPVFNAADAGTSILFLEAWLGALAYSFQLYFDFSGYSDMAIGLARMFGITLALNFNSPYKAVNIIEFWRSWHMTLSRFLRDYLYFPLGGSRKGKLRRYFNLMITMVIGGLWHGAGWTFIAWGALHGLYLIINHAWHAFSRMLRYGDSQTIGLGRGVGRLITFIAVVVGWVFFRAESFDAAINILAGMSGQHGIMLPSSWYSYLNLISGEGDTLGKLGFQHGVMRLFPSWAGLHVFLLLLIAWYAPNTQQIMINFKPALETYSGEIRRFYTTWVEWKPSLSFAIIFGLVFLYTILSLSKASEFLYFNF